MRRHRHMPLMAAAAAVVLSLGACSGGEDDSAAEVEPTAEETTTGPPAQPEGAHGITWEIQNWDEYAEDPAVLTWKQFNEAVAASITEGEFLPAALDLGSRDALDVYSSGMDVATSNDWRSQELTLVRVESSEETENGTALVTCVWSKTAELVTADGEYASDVDPVWYRQEVLVSEDDGGLVVSETEYDDTCEGEDPT